MNIDTLPPRIPASKVCELAGYKKGTLIRRIKTGKMPQPVDRGKENLFNTAEVLQKLGLTNVAPEKNPWD